MPISSVGVPVLENRPNARHRISDPTSSRFAGIVMFGVGEMSVSVVEDASADPSAVNSGESGATQYWRIGTSLLRTCRYQDGDTVGQSGNGAPAGAPLRGFGIFSYAGG